MKIQSTPPPANRKGLAFGAFVIAATLLSLAPLEQSQAQLMITIRPSASNTNNPILIFSGNTTASAAEAIRTSAVGSNEIADTFSVANLYSVTNLAGVVRSLSPLTTLAADDPDRIDQGDSAPTITFAVTNALTISRIAFDSQPVLGDHDLGIRVSSYHFYTSGNAVSWSGAGILTNFNMSQFNPGTYQSSSHPNFSSQSLRLTVNSRAIPEPEQYALIFGLFALGFVFFHRCITRKKRQHQATTS